MAHWVNKNQWKAPNGSTSPRSVGRTQTGTSGDFVTPNVYSCVYGNFPEQVRLPNGAYSPSVDVPNLSLLSRVLANGASEFPSARNKAWSELVDSMRDGSASLGQAFAEMPQSLSMVGDRALTLYRSYKHLRKGQFRWALRELNVPAHRRHRNWVVNKVNHASNLWLEYSFGWKPLLQDMYSGVTALGRPLPGGKMSGSGSASAAINYRTGSQTYQLFGRGFVKQGAEIYVTNPNTYALQQLGLANPLTIAWEVVPFSFMVDWVFDVGTALGGLTDLFGCTVVNPYTSTGVKLRGSVKVNWDYTPRKEWTVPGSCSAMKRVKSLSRPAPNIAFLANIGTSMNRAANAVSLLGQILTK